jgi:hypothetical protein
MAMTATILGAAKRKNISVIVRQCNTVINKEYPQFAVVNTYGIRILLTESGSLKIR